MFVIHMLHKCVGMKKYLPVVKIEYFKLINLKNSKYCHSAGFI